MQSQSRDVSAETQNSGDRRKRARTSSVWEYYSKKDINGTIRIACNVQNCKRSFSARSSTSTLRGHLNDHGFFLDSKQKHFASGGALVDEPAKPMQQRQHEFFLSLCHWIVDAGLPFSTVENSYFKHMISTCDSNIKVPCRTTVSKHVIEMQKAQEVSMKDKLKDIPGMVNVTTDAWSSRVYKGYLSITIHWVDKDWCLRNVLLDFVRFPTPHNGETTSNVLFELLSYWNIIGSVKAITTDNASDMCTAMAKLIDKMNIKNNTNRRVCDMHVRCIAHVVNLAVKDCLNDVHQEINSVRSLLSAIRCSVKRRDAYEHAERQLGLTVSLPSLDVPTRWSSTFNMIKNAYKARSILNTITSKVNDLRSYAVTNEVWMRASTICTFLESAASLTECQSGSSYATLSVTEKAFRALLSKCNTIMDSNDPLLKKIAEKMANKLLKYESLLCNDMAKLAQVLDPRFGSDILEDSDILRRHVVLPPADQQSEEAPVDEPHNASGTNFMQSILREDSLHNCYDDEILSFLRATALGDKRADPFEWWRSNEHRYPNVALVARDILAIPASSVCSEECFSVAGNLVDAHRTRLSDESIRSTMLLRAWSRLSRSITGEQSDRKSDKSVKPT